MNPQHTPPKPDSGHLKGESDQENPPGPLPGLQRHNDLQLGEHESIVVESILPDSPTDDELRGEA